MKLAGAYIHDEKYERLVALAESNNRTLAGQCRHLFDRALSGELQVPPHGAQEAQESGSGLLLADGQALNGAAALVANQDAINGVPPGAHSAAGGADAPPISLAALQKPGLPRRRARTLRPAAKKRTPTVMKEGVL
ncbi:hypothetical protein [Prosthecobacter sp.]|uniref:hypothetical protein n=1 Tax=Prosthecobacter sp. TaxID=1965333 RepID=UPI003784F90C